MESWRQFELPKLPKSSLGEKWTGISISGSESNGRGEGML